MSEMKISVQLATPPVPDFLSITSIRTGTLDEAFNKGLQIDIADMTDNDLDQVINRWGTALKRAAEQRRLMRNRRAAQNAAIQQARE